MKITPTKRGRKAKGASADHRVIDIVFLVRYGEKEPSAFFRGGVAPVFLPSAQGDFARRPGTVDGYRRVDDRLVKVRADCSVAEACKHAERDFQLKADQRRWWEVSVRPQSGERQEVVRPRSIAERRSEALMEEGTATRQWLYRALRAERELSKRQVSLDWDRAAQMDWNRKKSEYAARRKKKH